LNLSSVFHWPLPLRLALSAALGVLVVAPNLWLAWRSIRLILDGAPAVDWLQYVAASSRFSDPSALYAVTGDYAYHYSPFLAPIFGLLAPIRVVGWRVLHIAAVALLPTWPMRIVGILSWPFWYDVETGNILVFVVVLAAWALRGNRPAAIGYLALLILVPRPLMIPIGLWLLWQQPALRVPFVGLLIVHSTAVLVGGWGPDWLMALQASSSDVLNPSNIGPSRLVGGWWLIIGLPLAAYLTFRGRLGWASLAASLYWLPYYLLVLLLEVQHLGKVGPASDPRGKSGRR
jgi:hypothetical protein